MNQAAITTVSAGTVAQGQTGAIKRARAVGRTLPLTLTPQDTSVPYEEAVRRTSQLVVLLMEAADQRRTFQASAEQRGSRI